LLCVGKKTVGACRVSLQPLVDPKELLQHDTVVEALYKLQARFSNNALNSEYVHKQLANHSKAEPNSVVKNPNFFAKKAKLICQWIRRFQETTVMSDKVATAKIQASSGLVEPKVGMILYAL
jgi:hypothetical protein